MYRKTEIAVGLVALGLFVSAVALPNRKGSGFEQGQSLNLSVAISLPADSVKKDPETGLAVDDQLMLVKGQCTACHSSKLILQSHFSRDKWIERIRWMQRTQKLWDLGESEPAILSYLTKHYGPLENNFDGRREPLKPVKWYKLSR
jgi:hypothetical protein